MKNTEKIIFANLNDYLIKENSFLRKMNVNKNDIINLVLPNNAWGFFISKMKNLQTKWKPIGEKLSTLITPTIKDWEEALSKFKRKLSKKDFNDIYNRLMRYSDKKISDQFTDKFFDAKEKEMIVEKILEKIKLLNGIAGVVSEVLKPYIVSTIASGNYEMPLMSRGKPNSENPGSGIDEARQKMYDGTGVGGVSKKYDQLKIITKDRDWLDDEEIVDLLTDTRGPQNVIGSTDAYFYTTNDVDYYYSNPKGTGDAIPDGLPIDEEALKLKVDEPLINPYEKIKEKDYKRDNTQKYILQDQKLFNKRYWDEKIEPMKHSV
jgi:hypothetical protein